MIISIDGAIGAGKSTYLNLLKPEYPVFLEPVEEWEEHLNKFYVDPSRWGCNFNLQVLCSFAKIKDMNAPIILCERSPLACRQVFVQMHYDAGKMDVLELKTFDEIYKLIAWEPDVLIYIKTNPEYCLERIQRRGRKSEKDMPLEYLQKVHEKYENIKHLNIHIVDGERPQLEVLDDIKKIISLYKI